MFTRLIKEFDPVMSIQVAYEDKSSAAKDARPIYLDHFL